MLVQHRRRVAPKQTASRSYYRCLTHLLLSLALVCYALFVCVLLSEWNNIIGDQDQHSLYCVTFSFFAFAFGYPFHEYVEIQANAYLPIGAFSLKRFRLMWAARFCRSLVL